MGVPPPSIFGCCLIFPDPEAGGSVPHLPCALSSGLLNFTPRAAAEVASEQHEKGCVVFFFFFNISPPPPKLSVPHGQSGKARLNPELGFPTWCLVELLSQPRRALPCAGRRRIYPASAENADGD